MKSFAHAFESKIWIPNSSRDSHPTHKSSAAICELYAVKFTKAFIKTKSYLCALLLVSGLGYRYHLKTLISLSI